MSDDAFTLYDLRIEVPRGERPMICNHREGDWFALSGEFDGQDRAALRAVLAKEPGPAGEIYALERDKGGRHARIMKTNLNRS
jgi:hypothetical protein